MIKSITDNPMDRFTTTAQIDEAYIPTEQDWEDVFSEDEEFKFLFYGYRIDTGIHDLLAYLAPTADEALAKCLKLNPKFQIVRWDVADNF